MEFECDEEKNRANRAKVRIFRKANRREAKSMAQNKKRIRPDDELPEMTKKEFSLAKPLRDAMPDVVEAMKRGRGRPKVADPKQRVSLRLDPRVVAAYKATGTGWQSRINDVLAAALPKHRAKR